jgi:hypothetical protein
MKSWWQKYWFADEPYFDLGLMRLGVVGLQLITLVGVQFDKLTRVITLPTELYHPVALVRLIMSPWGWTTPPNTHLMFPLYWVTLIFGFGALIGLRTTWCMIVLALGSIFLQSYLFSFAEFHHNEAILLLALAALALAPCGRVLSIDSLIARRNHPTASRVALLDYRGPYAGWPIKFVQWLFPLIYLSAVISKIANNGYSLAWANGFTLQYYLLQDFVRKPDMALGLWASQFHGLLLFAQIIVLTYQVTYFLVIPFRKLCWIYLPVGLFFHFANYYALRAEFPEWILLLGVYIPWSVALKRLLAFEVAVPSQEQRAPPTARSTVTREVV